MTSRLKTGPKGAKKTKGTANVGEFDGEAGGEYDPALYTVCGKAELIPGLDAVTAADLKRYRDEGYLAIANVFDAAMVTAALDGLAHLIHGNVPAFKGISYEQGARDKIGSATPAQRYDLVRKLINYVDHDERLNAMAEFPPLKRLLRKIAGEDAILYQNQAMIKPPHVGREKPWHQDHAYFNVPLEKRIIGVWVALDPVGVENGCMHVLPGGHSQPIVHFRRRDWQICDTDILGQQAVAVELQPGGILIFDSLIPHGTPANKSDKRRRALQFHYRPESASLWPASKRMALFGEEGKDVQC